MSGAAMVLLAVAGLLALFVGLGLLWRFWPTLALVLLLAGIYTNRFKWEVGPVSIRAEQVIVLLLAGMLFLRGFVRGETWRFPLPGGYAVGWWLALAFSLVLNAPEPFPAARHVVRLALMVLIYFVTVNLVRTEQAWWRLVYGLWAVGLAEAAWGLLARAVYAWDFGTITLAGRTWQSPLNLGIQVTTSLPVPVPYGTLEEGNIFGSTMAALLLLSLALGVQPPPGFRRRWAVLGVGLTGSAWLLSLARGAWLSVALVLPALWVLYPRQSAQRWGHAALLLLAAPLFLVLPAVAVVALPPTSPVVARLQTFARLSSDPTFSLRMERWVYAWEDIRLRPLLGWGPGTFEQLHGLQRYAPAWLDSLTIKALQEGGLWGMVFLYGFWGTAIGEGIYTLLKRPTSPARGAILGLTLGAAALFLAYHATDATWLGFMWVWLAALTTHPHSRWTTYDAR